LVRDFSYTFYNCRGLTGNSLPLWMNYPNATSNYCYSYCTSLDDYATIPANWK